MPREATFKVGRKGNGRFFVDVPASYAPDGKRHKPEFATEGEAERFAGRFRARRDLVKLGVSRESVYTMAPAKPPNRKLSLKLFKRGNRWNLELRPHVSPNGGRMRRSFSSEKKALAFVEHPGKNVGEENENARLLALFRYAMKSGNSAEQARLEKKFLEREDKSSHAKYSKSPATARIPSPPTSDQARSEGNPLMS
jgi:hypothetical protein